jgi:acetylornithine deacetylase
MYQRAAQLLSDLVSIETVNPMGSRFRGNVPVERPAIEYLEAIFAPYDVTSRRQACGDLHENLLITVPGKSMRPGLLLESHVDTVPAHDWPVEAFRPRVENKVLFGRGACDDKGSLTAMVLATLELLESGITPERTVWLLAARDEEYSQTGIKTFLSSHTVSIGGAVFGEPTNCVPVIQHKGMIRWDITVRGRSAHTSNPSLGRNAILDMIRLARLLAIYLLKSTNTVEHVEDLSIGAATTNGVKVNFRGVRAKRYSNADPAVIECEGVCPLLAAK